MRNQSRRILRRLAGSERAEAAEAARWVGTPGVTTGASRAELGGRYTWPLHVAVTQGASRAELGRRHAAAAWRPRGGCAAVSRGGFARRFRTWRTAAPLRSRRRRRSGGSRRGGRSWPSGRRGRRAGRRSRGRGESRTRRTCGGFTRRWPRGRQVVISGGSSGGSGGGSSGGHAAVQAAVARHSRASHQRLRMAVTHGRYTCTCTCACTCTCCRAALAGVAPAEPPPLCVREGDVTHPHVHRRERKQAVGGRLRPDRSAHGSGESGGGR